MDTQGYNGWANRETWLVNLWLGEYLAQAFEETDISTLADCIEEELYRMLDEQVDEVMFKDFIDLGAVNWLELASHYVKEVQ